MSSTETRTIDTSQLTPLQKTLHLPTSISDKVESGFMANLQKTTYCKIYDKPLEGQATNIGDTGGTQSSGMTFTIDSSACFLLEAAFKQQLPQVSVAEQYADEIQICWPTYPVHNIIVSSQLMVGTISLGTIDTNILDNHSQWYRDIDEYTYNRKTGNVALLTEWKTVLPPTIVSVKLPHSFSHCQANALPLLIFASKKTAEFKMKLRRMYKQLIKMRRKNMDGTYTDIKFNHEYLDGVGKDEELPIPTLLGRYGDITKEEYDDFMKKSSHDTIIFQYITNKEAKETKDSVSLSSAYPVNAIHFFAENCSVGEYGCQSNYTSNKRDILGGFCPIRSFTLMDSDETEIISNDTHYSSLMIADKFVSAPAYPGYNAIPFCEEMTLLDRIKTGIDPGKYTMNFVLDDGGENNTYKMRVIMIVTARMSVDIKSASITFPTFESGK